MPEAVSAANAPTSGYRGVLGTLVTTTRPPSTATRSVKVPPTSTPTRIESRPSLGRYATRPCNTYTSRIEVATVKKLTITVDNDVYRGLKKKVGPRRISRFLNDLARPHVVDDDLLAAYRGRWRRDRSRRGRGRGVGRGIDRRCRDADLSEPARSFEAPGDRPAVGEVYLGRIRSRGAGGEISRSTQARHRGRAMMRRISGTQSPAGRYPLTAARRREVLSIPKRSIRLRGESSQGHG